MDVAASIIGLAQGAQALFNYVANVHEGLHAPAELLESLVPLSSLLNTLVLKVRPPCQNAELESTAILLCSPEGPFTQLHTLIEQLLTKVERSSASSTGPIRKFVQALKWPFDKGEVAELMQKIERVKSLITLALQNDLVALNNMIRDDIREAKKGIDDLSADISGVGNKVQIPTAGLHDAQLSTTGHGSSMQINAQGVHLGSVGGSAFSHNIIQMGDPAVGRKVDILTPMVERLQSHHMSDDMRKFADWLSRLDFQTTQQHLISQWTPGTVKWFIENAKFQDWTAGKFGVLWCPGEPGVGKTILASRVIDHLQRECLRPGVGLAYIFFRYNEANTQDIRALVASILRQLLIGNTIPDWLIPLYDSFKAGRPLSQDLNTLVNALDSQIHSYSNVYLVVDAFDECSEDIRDNFLSTFRPLTDSNRLHILVTSRLLLSIESQFKGDQQINVRAHDNDVRAHILDQIRKHKRLEKLVKGGQAGFENEIMGQIIENAAGMFLLVHLHLESLKNIPNCGMLRKALAILPDAIHNSYDTTMHRINSQGKFCAQLAKQVFKWLVYVKRPLTMLELRHALAISLESTRMNHDDITEAERLIEICGGLVIMEKNHKGVDFPRLVHYTTKEYFELKNESLFPDGQLELATACLTYLCFDTLHSKIREIDEYPGPDQEPHVLVQYAADHWGDHGRECEDQLYTDHKGLLLQFLQHDRIVDSRKYLFGDEWQLQWGNGLGSLGRFGLSKLLESILNDSTVINDAYGLGLALLFAVHFNHATIVRLLVMRATLTNQETTRACIIDPNVSYDLDLDPDLGIGDNHSALTVAARVGSVEFVTLLLHLPGLNLNASSGYNKLTPLNHAAREGHLEVVALLMQHADINVNSTNIWGNTALHGALSGGHQKTAELLLGHPEIQPNLPNNAGVLPWMLAGEKEYQGIMELLLARDNVDPNGQDEEFLTPLSHAVVNGLVRLMQYLLSLPQINFATSFNMAYAARGHYALRSGGYKEVIDLLRGHDDLDPNVQSYKSRGPLSWAAAEGHIDWVEFLLQLPGIIPDLRDTMEPRTPLSYAAEKGSMKTMRILMQCNDVDPNSQDKHGQTPLHYALQTEFWQPAGDSVTLLLTHPNIQPDCPDYTGRTPLSYAAAEYRNSEMVALLVQREDVDINSQDVYGRTPLSYAIEKRNVDAALHLLNLPGIHANLADRRGITPLMYSAMGGGYDNITLFMRLLNHDAVDRNQLDFQGRTLLMFCAMAWDGEAAEYLLDSYDMDPNAKSKGLQTALSIAAGRPNLEVASLLLSQGDVDCNIRDRHGRTPLYIAVESLHIPCRYWYVEEVNTPRRQEMIDLLRQYGAEEDGPDLLQCLNDVECNEIWDCLYG